MNKTKILLVAALAVAMLAGCGRNDDMDNGTSPTPAQTDNANVGDGTTNNGNTTNKGNNANNGTNAVEDIVGGAGNAVKDVTDGVGNAVKDAGNAMNNAVK